MISGIIYVTQNLVNGKIYVGIHTKYQKDYLGSGKYLNRAIKKYGRENFKRIDVDEFDDIEIGLAKERFWIQEMNSRTPNGYNLNDGGRGNLNPCQETRTRMSIARKGKPPWSKGKHHSEETKTRMSNAAKGRVFSDEHKIRLSISKKGKPGHPQSEEVKRKISLAHLGKVYSEEHNRRMGLAKRGKSTWNKGKHHSAETKVKISVAKTGKHLSEETRAKMSKAKMGNTTRRGSHLTEEQKKKISIGLHKRFSSEVPQ